MVILDADRILPKAPDQLPWFGMFKGRFIVDFRPHLAFVTADRIPIQLIAFDLIDLAVTLCLMRAVPVQ
jgi:hypothetical protein